MLNYKEFVNEVQNLKIGELHDVGITPYTVNEYYQSNGQVGAWSKRMNNISEEYYNRIVMDARIVFEKEQESFEIIEKLSRSELLNDFYIKSFVDDDKVEKRHFIKLQFFNGKIKVAKIYPFDSVSNYFKDITVDVMSIKDVFISNATNIEMLNKICYFGDPIIIEQEVE